MIWIRILRTILIMQMKIHPMEGMKWWWNWGENHLYKWRNRRNIKQTYLFNRGYPKVATLKYPCVQKWWNSTFLQFWFVEGCRIGVVKHHCRLRGWTSLWSHRMCETWVSLIRWRLAACWSSHQCHHAGNVYTQDLEMVNPSLLDAGETRVRSSVCGAAPQ